MTTPPTRRVGLSIRHSPGQLLKSWKPNSGTTTAAAATTTTTAAKTTTKAKTTTVKTTIAANKSDSKPRGGRSQLKIPEPIPEDIFAPPLASSDVDDDDDNDNNDGNAENAELGLESNEQARLYADSSDSEAPARGAISATKFTSSNQDGRRSSLRTRSQETKATSQLPKESDEVEPGTRKRKRVSSISNNKGNSKRNAVNEPDTSTLASSSASHLTNSQGFVKKPKVRTTFSGRRSINSQESRKSRGLYISIFECQSAMINASQSQKNLRCPNLDASQSQKNLHYPYFDLSNIVLSSLFERAPSSSSQILTIFRLRSNNANLVNDCCTLILATTATLMRKITMTTTGITTVSAMATSQFSVNRNLPLTLPSPRKTSQRKSEDKIHCYVWRRKMLLLKFKRQKKHRQSPPHHHRRGS